MRDRDRIRGCIVGGACGDALGYPVEFMGAEEIAYRYGPGGIRHYEPIGGRAIISDDTQMTLFTAAGLMRCTAETARRNGGRVPAVFIGTAFTEALRGAYLDWYRTQTGGPGPGLTWLSGVDELYSRRAPGTTCLSALSRGGRGSIEKPINDSAGCGGVMRVAPIGLYFGGLSCGMANVDALGAKAAALTHGHPRAWLPAAALVHIIQCLIEGGMDMEDSVEECMTVLPKIFPEHRAAAEELSALIERAFLYGCDPESGEELEVIESLGQGWVGDEALAIGIFCALRHRDDLAGAIISAVNHGGDSDSTGSVCGQIVGAALGYRAIPGEFLEPLELRDELLRIADDLAREPGEIGEDWIGRYLR